MDVAEITIRVGETMLDRACVAAGEQFCIGELPGVQLAVAGIGAFPLVTGTPDGFVLRVPIGTALVLDGRVCNDTELRLAPERVARIRFGLADVELRLVALTRIAIPRPPPEARPVAYTVLSLLAHLSVWAAAIELAPGIAFGTGTHARSVAIGGYRRFAPSAAQPAPAATPATAAALDDAPELASERPQRASSPASATKTREHARGTSDTIEGPGSPGSAHDAGEAIVAAVGEVARTFDGVDLGDAFSNLHPLYRPDEAPGFGRTRLFDPTNRAEFRTIPAGRFATISSGPHAGAGYDIAGDIQLCAAADCEVAGPIDGAQLRDAIGTKSAHLGGCFGARHGTITVAVAIDQTGHVAARAAAGTRDIAECAARFVAELELPAAEQATLASISIEH